MLSARLQVKSVMKNFALLFASILLLTACSKKDQPDIDTDVAIQNIDTDVAIQSLCTINGYDCWKVVQLLEKTQIVGPTEEELNQYLATLKDEENEDVSPISRILRSRYRGKLNHYENPELQKMGLTVTHTATYFDGGSKSYTFSNEITVFKKWDTSGLGWKNITITFPTLEKFVFDQFGNIVSHTPPQDCIVNKKPCSQLVQELNSFFTDKPNLKKSIHPITKQEIYNEHTCDEETCVISPRRSDKELVGIPPGIYQQNGEIYTYTLIDGRTLLFNWESNDSEHGFLTVSEVNGRRRKFDPQGKQVN